MARFPIRASVVAVSLYLSLIGRLDALEPAFIFGPETVVVSGMTPGGELVLFGVSRENTSHAATIVRREEMATDEDKDGIVRLELGGPVPLVSIFAAVDVATGALALATPEGFPLQRYDLPARNVRGGGGRADWLDDVRSQVELLVVRPGTDANSGAWGATVGDGGESDEGPYDGHVVAGLDSFRQVGKKPRDKPFKFRPKDVIVAIDPNRMVVFIRQLLEAPQ